MTALFHHISLLTGDEKQNRHFYTEILGLRLVKHTVNQENFQIPHLYYGDYLGSPSTVITFFIVPRLGSRYENKNYLADVGWNIPKGSLAYWKKRLTDYQIPFNQVRSSLHFSDPDHVFLTLTETNLPPLSQKQVVPTRIPAEFQLLNLRLSSLHISDLAKTSQFFERFLGLETKQEQIALNEHSFLNLYQSTSLAKSRMGRGSIDHIALAIPDTKQLQLLYTRAQEQGWQIEKLISRGYFTSLYIREPGGNRIEFATMAPGFTFDEPLEQLGEHFLMPTFLANFPNEKA